jgi:ubiquinone/menaquinone biosynthesis C-methylase UbiE
MENKMSAQFESKKTNATLTKNNLAEAKNLKLIAYQYFEEAQEQVSQSVQYQSLLLKAVDNIHKALEFDQNDPDSFNLLARVQLESSNYHMAQQAINQALELNPNNGGYQYSAGHIALACNELEKAKVLFRKAIKLAPKETKAETSLAYTLAQSGDVVEAFSHFRELAKTQGNDIHIRSQLLETASQVKADYYDPELEQDLLHYLSWSDMNLNLLASLSSSLLECKFQIDQTGSAAQFEEISSCPLLVSSLRNTLIKSPLLERLIMALRSELLIYATKQGQLANKHIPLCEAIAQYGLRCEYLLPCTQSELGMISTLKDIIDKSLNQVGCTPMDIAGALSLVAMYEQWSSLENINTLRGFPEQDWPDFIKELRSVQENLYTLKDMKFEKLTKIPKSIDQAVKGQYEKYPYPCWNNLDYKKTTLYGVALKNEYPNANLPSHIFNKKLEVLVAGCGTGRHALNVAKFFKGVNVLAIDISHQSLAYAKNKTEKLNLSNIEFKQADLTTLPLLNKKFNIIECSGVLHHIKEDQKALQNLLINLMPNGLIKISLYSERARRNITNMRSIFNKTLKNDHQIKVARQAIMHSEDKIITESIISSNDFYSMSGTVDLLFHEYEKCFTPTSIKKLCFENNLKWLGFSNLTHSAKSNFTKLHGLGADFQCLDKWEVFEELHPDTFSGMYQFYCQYQPKLQIK